MVSVVPHKDISGETAFVAQVLPTKLCSVEPIYGSLLNTEDLNLSQPKEEFQQMVLLVALVNHFGEGYVLVPVEAINSRLGRV